MLLSQIVFLWNSTFILPIFRTFHLESSAFLTRLHKEFIQVHPSPSFPHLSKPDSCSLHGFANDSISLLTQINPDTGYDNNPIFGILITPLSTYSSYRNATIAADSAAVTLVSFSEGSSSTTLEFGVAMSEARAVSTAATAGSEMRRGRRRFGGGGGGEAVWRGILSFVAAMQTIALAASSFFGASGKMISVRRGKRPMNLVEWQDDASFGRGL